MLAPAELTVHVDNSSEERSLSLTVATVFALSFQVILQSQLPRVALLCSKVCSRLRATLAYFTVFMYLFLTGR